jgi:hypothetical protein
MAHLVVRRKDPTRPHGRGDDGDGPYDVLFDRFAGHAEALRRDGRPVWR